MQFEFYIAVYGTLKKGERNFCRLPQGHVRVVDDVLTDEAIFQMHINPSTTTPDQMTPSVTLKDGCHYLHVQIMAVTKFGRDEMDRIEGVGKNYDRVPVKIEKYPGTEIYLKRDSSDGVVESPHRVYDLKNNSLCWKAHP